MRRRAVAGKHEPDPGTGANVRVTRVTQRLGARNQERGATCRLQRVAGRTWVPEATRAAACCCKGRVAGDVEGRGCRRHNREYRCDRRTLGRNCPQCEKPSQSPHQRRPGATSTNHPLEDSQQIAGLTWVPEALRAAACCCFGRVVVDVEECGCRHRRSGQAVHRWGAEKTPTITTS